MKRVGENTEKEELTDKKNVPQDKKKKISLDDFKVNAFVSEVDLDDMQFLNTAGG